MSDGERRKDGEEGRAFFEGLREDLTRPACEDIVDAAENFGYELLLSVVRCTLCCRKNLLLAWISHEYIAKSKRGLQSKNPCLIAP